MFKNLTVSSTMHLLFVVVMTVLSVSTHITSAQTLQCNWDGTYSLTPVLDPTLNPWLEQCIDERCVITTNAIPTILSTTNIACNNDWATERNTDCAALQNGYNAFFACVYVNLANNLIQVNPNNQNSICLRVQSQSFIITPGFPYHMTNLTQYATNYFTEVVSPNLNLNVNNRCPNLPQLCCLQSPLSTTIYDDGKYYNYILCGIGCKTGLFLMAFTIISIAMFVCCGLCWPTPSLKQTAKQYKEEEAAAIAAACRGEDTDSQTYNNNNNNIEMIIQRSTVYLQEDETNVNNTNYDANANNISAVDDKGNRTIKNNPLQPHEEVQKTITTVKSSNNQQTM